MAARARRGTGTPRHGHGDRARLPDTGVRFTGDEYFRLPRGDDGRQESPQSSAPQSPRRNSVSISVEAAELAKKVKSIDVRRWPTSVGDPHSSPRLWVFSAHALVCAPTRAPASWCRRSGSGVRVASVGCHGWRVRDGCRGADSVRRGARCPVKSLFFVRSRGHVRTNARHVFGPQRAVTLLEPAVQRG